MRLLRRKAPIPPLPERPPDLIIDGKPLWVVKADPEELAFRRAAAAKERAIEAARWRESHQPYGHMWMEV